MGMLTFYPWLRLDGPRDCGAHQLLPWSRRNPVPAHFSSEVHQTIATILSPFMQGVEASIDEAVVVLHPDRELLDDLTEAERREFFDLHELISFSGLAGRLFFDQQGYLNAGNFRPIIQAFTTPGRGVASQSRRRDGYTQAYTPHAFQREPCPEHVHLHDRAPIDPALLSALVAARDADDERLLASVPLFNLANTDSNVVAERTELILLCSAFERLLDSKPKMNAIVENFSTALASATEVDRSEVGRIPENKYQKFNGTRSVWMADFFSQRGSLAHGHPSSSPHFIWSIQEHLLLGAFVFPLLVKLRLASASLYDLNRWDHAHLNAFDQLAAHEDLFAETTDGQWPWKEIIADAYWGPLDRMATIALGELAQGGSES